MYSLFLNLKFRQFKKEIKRIANRNIYVVFLILKYSKKY